ncbi:MAG: TMEM175 family protein [Actinomycetota bacterium]
MAQDPLPPVPPNAYVRHGEGLEFDRVVFFTDAVFAIALTLLVVDIGIPTLRGPAGDSSTMLDALSDTLPEVISFFIAFIVIGRYWLAHHLFFGQLRAVDRPLISLNLLYLAFVAFLPWPTALVGDYEQNPISVLLLAACLAIISGLEVVQFHYAYKHNLMRQRIPPDVYRFGVIGSLTPVAVFILSAPLAFVSSTLCLTSWLVTIPIGIILDRRGPRGARQIMLGARR